MTNREKYVDEILDIIGNGEVLAVEKILINQSHVMIYKDVKIVYFTIENMKNVKIENGG